MIGASAALHVSHIPFLQADRHRPRRPDRRRIRRSCRRTSQLEESDLDLIVAGTRDAITMIEGFAREMPEDEHAAGHPVRPTSTSSPSST